MDVSIWEFFVTFKISSIPSRRIRQTCVWVHLTPSRSDSDNDHLSCQLSVHEASDNENDKLLLLQLETMQAHLWSNFSNRFNEIHKISVELGHTIVANQHVVDENLPSIQRAQTCRKCQVPWALLYSIMIFVVLSRCNHSKSCAASRQSVKKESKGIRCKHAIWLWNDEDMELPITSLNTYPTCEPPQ